MGMPKGKDWLHIVGTTGMSLIPTMLYRGAEAMKPPKMPSLEAMEAKAEKETRRKARLRSKELKEGGKTLFTSPLGTADPKVLKTKLGA